MVALLAVRRDGVVDERLHSVVCKVLLKTVTAVTEYGIDVRSEEHTSELQSRI